MERKAPPDGPTVLADRYELGSRLGSGGMADVYRAHDTLLGRDVAIKVFRDAVTEERFDERQRAEISLLSRLNHPGLVTVFDAGSGLLADGTHRAYLVMELVRGPSLAERLTHGPVPAAQAALVGAHVAESLAYIHAHGVVHRDVKPANILLPGDERVGTTQPWTKLTDFGIARLVESAHLTSTGLLLGTPGYLSPEQATGTSPGPPTDVYALGLVVLECLTATRAFPGTGLESAVARLHRDPEIPAGLGASWTALLRSMTDRDAAERPTATEATGALRELVAVPEPTQVMPAAPEATRVMAAAPEATLGMPAAPTPPIADDAATRVLQVTDGGRDAAPRGAPPAHRLSRRAVAVLATGVVAAAVGLGLWLVPDDGAEIAPVTYPPVPGQLGEHLQQLQESVTP